MIRVGFVLFLLCCSLSAAEQRDGKWWRQLSQNERAAYIIGLIDGTEAVSGLESTRMSPSNYAAHRANVRVTVGRATAGQIVDGLNQFYRDFRNRGIGLIDGFWSVTMSIAGVPQAPEQIEDLRRKAHWHRANDH